MQQGPDGQILGFTRQASLIFEFDHANDFVNYYQILIP